MTKISIFEFWPVALLTVFVFNITGCSNLQLSVECQQHPELEYCPHHPYMFESGTHTDHCLRKK